MKLLRQSSLTDNIANQGASGLASMVITNAVVDYSNCLILLNSNQNEKSYFDTYLQKLELESFFKSNLYKLYASLAELDMTGEQIMKKVKMFHVEQLKDGAKNGKKED